MHRQSKRKQGYVPFFTQVDIYIQYLDHNMIYEGLIWIISETLLQS